MRPVTDSFLNTVRGPHKAVFRARICEPWQSTVNPVGTVIPVVSGDTTFDTNSDVNGTLDFKTSVSWDSLVPYRHEVYIERGVQYANGIREYVGLGYFRVNSIEQETPRSDKGGTVQAGLLRVTGEDRMSNLRDARVVSPIQFSSSASVASVIDFLVQDVMPTVVTIYDTTNWPGGTAAATLLGSSHIVDQDRLKFIQELVTAYGKVCYFDYAGRFVVKDAPQPTGSPIFVVNAGANGVLVQATRTISRDGVFNAVVASGEPAGEQAPVYGIAYDSNPSSPTLWGGGFGKVPKFFTSSFLTTASQCVQAAQNLLNSTHGFPYTVSLGMVPNPALEAWDVIKVQYDDNMYENHIAELITCGLSVEGPMRIETRKQFLY